MQKATKTALDRLWQKAVRVGKDSCEYCGKKGALNGHHIFTRSRMNTRWDIENGILLCVGCHTFSSRFSAHKTPYKFFKWLEKERGAAWVNTLQKKSDKVAKGTNKEKIMQKLQDMIYNQGAPQKPKGTD